MLTNLEKQAQRNIEARKRVALEEAEFERQLQVRITQFESDPVYYSECCGAPDTIVAASKYYNRHIRGAAGYPKSEPCEFAREARRLQQRNQYEGLLVRELADYEAEYLTMPDCWCGTPHQLEASEKYFRRHKGVDQCERSKACLAAHSRERRAKAKGND